MRIKVSGVQRPVKRFKGFSWEFAQWDFCHASQSSSDTHSVSFLGFVTLVRRSPVAILGFLGNPPRGGLFAQEQTAFTNSVTASTARTSKK
jgi:hypothetical protein